MGTFKVPGNKPFQLADNVPVGAAGNAARPGAAAGEVAGAARPGANAAENVADAAKPSVWNRGKEFAKANKNTILGAGGAVAAAGLFTGLAFLPEELVDAAANALFGWLPEEQRKGACSLCSSCFCCSSMLLVVGLVVFIVMGQMKS